MLGDRKLASGGMNWSVWLRGVTDDDFAVPRSSDVIPVGCIQSMFGILGMSAGPVACALPAF